MLKRPVTLLITAAAAVSSVRLPVVNAESDNEFTDSGISYTEQVGTIINPGAGYTTTVWANCAPGNTPVFSPKGSLALFFIDIGKFSSGANGTTDEDGTYTPGKDYDLDETFFASWRQTLENCRQNGCMVGLRFRYDANGKDDPEPASFDQVLAHIAQIKESGLLEDYKDIIALVESGFVGKWGEQHGGKYTSVEYKSKLLDALLEAVPETIHVTVRTPDTFAVWAGHKRSELADQEIWKAAESSSDPVDKRILSKRVGMYNDGYMGSNSDLGTYADRERETEWLSSVAEETYYGGEFSGNIEFAQQYDTYLPENALSEMYKTHLSYINGNIFQLYKNYTFGEEYDIEGVDNSAYYGQNVFQFIRDHLGYRFVLRNSELTANVSQGGNLKLRFSIENTGFANPIPHTQGYIILEKDGIYVKSPVDLDCHNWRSCTTTDIELTMKLPDTIRTGSWNVYLKETMGGYSDELAEMPLRSIRFANEGVWNNALGADLLGTVNISASSSNGTDNYFRQVTENDVSEGSDEYLNACTSVVIDGAGSFSGEWTEDMKLAEKDDLSISVRADEQYLYVMSKMPEGAAAPVYNISLKNNGEKYWLYYASNGFIYFDHESHDGCDCKWNGNTVEFRLPLETFGLSSGSTITDLRVFLQDSGNDWKLMGDITAKEYTVDPSLSVYTAEKDVKLKEGEELRLNVKTPVKNAQYQWLRDGVEIGEQTSETLSISSAAPDDSGLYSVRVTYEDIVDEFPIAAVVVKANAKTALKGDANCDDEVNMADAVLIMQAVSNPDKYNLSAQGELNADIDGSGVTNKDALIIQQFKLGLIETLTAAE